METNLKDMTDLYTCPNCSRSYRADKLAECPRCFARGPGVVDEKRVSAKNWAGLMNSASSDYSGSTLIVAAQDRTTHAIRSLAIFVLVSISTALIGYIIIAINAGSALGCGLENLNCYSNSGGGIVFGFVVIAVGFVLALVLGFRELTLSKP